MSDRTGIVPLSELITFQRTINKMDTYILNELMHDTTVRELANTVLENMTLQEKIDHFVTDAEMGEMVSKAVEEK